MSVLLLPPLFISAPFFYFLAASSSFTPRQHDKDATTNSIQGDDFGLVFFFIVVAVLLPISFVVYLLYVLTRYIPLIAPKTSETERFNGDNYNNLPFQSIYFLLFMLLDSSSQMTCMFHLSDAHTHTLKQNSEFFACAFSI